MQHRSYEVIAVERFVVVLKPDHGYFHSITSLGCEALRFGVRFDPHVGSFAFTSSLRLSQ